MKIGILGHFGMGMTLLNGQTVKTKNLTEGLKAYTDAAVVPVDTHGWSRAPFRLLRQIREAFRQCDGIIMLPAHNGVRVFAPVLLYFRQKFGKKVFYDVIGGWLPALVQQKKHLAKQLKAFDGIWVETETMRRALEAQGFQNVSVVPNFKELSPLKEECLVYPQGLPYKLCTFSRVMQEKGIQTAAEAVKKVNRELGYTAFSLDIYGQVDGGQTQWFEQLQQTFPDYIRYCGCVDSAKSVEVLKDYFALLFPTHFYTEGIPGTIIDAYAAGVPVISARWESYADVVEENVTGLGYDFGRNDQLEALLRQAAAEPARLLDRKPDCLKKASEFMTQTVMASLMQKL